MLFGSRQQIVSDFVLDGQSLRVVMDAPQGSDACVWAYADDWSYLMPGSLPEDQREYWQQRLESPDDVLDRAMLRPLAFDLARQVYGVPWWTAHRILVEASQSYLAYQAWCVKNGFDPGVEPADRIVASVVSWVSEGWSDDTESKSWWQRMSMPPVGVR